MKAQINKKEYIVSESGSNTMIHVWVVDDHKEQRKEVSILVNGAPDMSCENIFPNCERLFEYLEENNGITIPDVVIMDYQLDSFSVEAHMNGIEGAQRLKQAYPKIAIVMLTINDSVDTIFRAIGSGACGYIIKPPKIDTLLSAIRQAHAGGLWMPPMVAQRVSDYFQELISPGENILSDREREVLSMMEQGLKQKQIAEMLNLSRHTVDSHLRNIYQKLHVNSAHEALAKAIRKGYL